MALTDKLTAIADAIRGKTGTTDGLTLDAMPAAIEGISGGSSGGWPEAPDDGKTRLYITLHEGRTSPMLGVCPNGTVTVNWGDGTEPDVLTGTDATVIAWTPNHAYAAPGDYVITLTVDGEMGLIGQSNNLQRAAILRYASMGDKRNTVYLHAVKQVIIGSGVTSIGKYAFMGCSALASITIPESVTSIGDSAFYGCSTLASIAIPENVTSIGSGAFQNCSALASITIPENVTSIGGSAFYGCLGMAYYNFTSHTSVPTLSGTNAFYNIVDDCEIRVPAALYDEWIAATNWATYASYIKAY